MFLTLFVFILLLAILVFVHELGHYSVAKKFGVRVDEFGFGLPPRIVGWHKNPESKKFHRIGAKKKFAENTIYSLNWIPLGGFVKIKGEQGEMKQDIDSFGHKPVIQRIAILSAGVVMNVLLTVFLFTVGYIIGMPQEYDSRDISSVAKARDIKIVFAEILQNSPAEKSGIRAGDSLLEIDGKKFSDMSEVKNYIASNKKELNLLVERDKKIFPAQVTPEIIQNSEHPIIGVDIVQFATVSYPWHYAFFEAVKTTGFFAKEIIFAFYNLLQNLIVKSQISVDLSGPVGIAVMTGEVTKLGFIYILQFAALLSLNLAIINFLPFPALDGGRVLFLLIEKLRGRPVDSKIESFIHQIGLSLLLILVAFVTLKDIIRFSDRFQNLWANILNIF